MNYNEQLSANNEALAAILETANNLPAAGGVLYTPQELTEDQKTQARLNIEAVGYTELNGKQNKIIGAQGQYVGFDANGNLVAQDFPVSETTETEELSCVYSTSYPNASTFVYTESTTSYATIVYKESTIKGGVFSLDFDTAKISKFEIILHLFKDGQPYKRTQRSSGLQEFSGELIEPTWLDPGTGSGFNYVSGAFSVKVPEDCTIMACCRFNASNTTIPSGSDLVTNNLGDAKHAANWAKNGGVTCTVTKTTAGSGTATGGIGGAAVSVVNYTNPNVRAINHRGYNTVAPENTLSAYRLSKKMGFDYVECDVLLTSDGVPVLLHDDTVDRTSDGTGKIVEMTFEQARALDFGSWKSAEYAGEQIPTLEEFVLLCKNIGLHPYIELKQTTTFTQAQINEFVQIVKRNGMQGKVTYISMSHTYLTYFKNADPKARLGYVVGDVTSTVVNNANALKTDDNEVFIDAGINYITQDGYANAINSGFPLEMWTLDADTILTVDPYVTGYTCDDARANVILYDANVT